MKSQAWIIAGVNLASKLPVTFRTFQLGSCLPVRTFSDWEEHAVPTTMRQILAISALVILTVGLYVVNARTAPPPQGPPANVAAPLIGILGLMVSAKDLPEQHYEAF